LVNFELGIWKRLACGRL